MCIMSEHYDVVIVGTGAGGGTLASALAKAGKRILLLERGDFLPREMDNWDPEPVFVDGKYMSPDTWYDSAGQPFQPQVHYYVGGATKMYGAALYRLRPGLRRDQARGRPVAGLAAELRRASSPGTPRPSGSTRCTARTARTPPRGPAPGSTRGRRSRTSRASSRSPTRWPPAGYHPFHAPCGILLDEAHRPASACIRCAWCDGYPCLVHAKSDAETIAVRPLLTDPNVTLLVNAEVDAAGDRPGRAHGDRRGGVAGRQDRGLQRRHRRGLRRGGQHAPGSCCGRPATSTRGAWPTARTSSAATTCSTTARPWWHCAARSQRHGLPEDPGPERLLPRRPAATSGRWATSRCSASPTRWP